MSFWTLIKAISFESRPSKHEIASNAEVTRNLLG